MPSSTPTFTFDDLKFHEIDEVWSGVDANIVGRFLRAHLVVEHFVDENLRKINPSLGAFDRLSFSNKVELLNPTSAFVQWIRPGIRKLNALRNKFAHQLNYKLTHDDVRFIFGDEKELPKYLNAFKRIADPAQVVEPIDVIEAFADFVAQMLRLEKTLADKLEEAVAIARKDQNEKLKRLAALAGEPIDESDETIDDIFGDSGEEPKPPAGA